MVITGMWLPRNQVPRTYHQVMRHTPTEYPTRRTCRDHRHAMALVTPRPGTPRASSSGLLEPWGPRPIRQGSPLGEFMSRVQGWPNSCHVYRDGPIHVTCTGMAQFMSRVQGWPNSCHVYRDGPIHVTCTGMAPLRTRLERVLKTPY